MTTTTKELIDKEIYEDIDNCHEGIKAYITKEGLKIVYSLEAGYSKGTSIIPLEVLQKHLQELPQQEVEIKRDKILHGGFCICNKLCIGSYCSDCGAKIKRID